MKNYLIILTCFFLLGCMKDDEITVIPYEETPAETNYYFNGLIDNVQHDYNTESVEYYTSYSVDHFNCDTANASFNHILSSFITKDNTTKTPKIYLSKGSLSTFGSGGIVPSTFENFFTVGNYTFSNTFGGDGFTVHYKDTNGNEWSSRYGTGIQANSSISITEVTIDDIINADVLISFNCKIYDLLGNSMEITNAKFLGKFVNSQSHR